MYSVARCECQLSKQVYCCYSHILLTDQRSSLTAVLYRPAVLAHRCPLYRPAVLAHRFPRTDQRFSLTAVLYRPAVLAHRCPLYRPAVLAHRCPLYRPAVLAHRCPLHRPVCLFIGSLGRVDGKGHFAPITVYTDQRSSLIAVLYTDQRSSLTAVLHTYHRSLRTAWPQRLTGCGVPREKQCVLKEPYN